MLGLAQAVILVPCNHIAWSRLSMSCPGVCLTHKLHVVTSLNVTCMGSSEAAAACQNIKLWRTQEIS